MKKNILIVDDHELIMGGLKFLLESHFAGAEVDSVGTIHEAKEQLAVKQYTVAILDIKLPDGYGLELKSAIQALQENCRYMVLTGETQGAEIFKAISLGHDVIVSKIDPVETILEAVEALDKGHSYTSPSITKVIESNMPSMTLPPRSMEVLLLLNRGFSNKQIAHELDVALPTVSYHLRELRERLGALQNREILAKAQEHGMI